MARLYGEPSLLVLPAMKLLRTASALYDTLTSVDTSKTVDMLELRHWILLLFTSLLSLLEHDPRYRICESFSRPLGGTDAHEVYE